MSKAGKKYSKLSGLRNSYFQTIYYITDHLNASAIVRA